MLFYSSAVAMVIWKWNEDFLFLSTLKIWKSKYKHSGCIEKFKMNTTIAVRSYNKTN